MKEDKAGKARAARREEFEGPPPPSSKGGQSKAAAAAEKRENFEGAGVPPSGGHKSKAAAAQEKSENFEGHGLPDTRSLETRVAEEVKRQRSVGDGKKRATIAVVKKCIELYNNEKLTLDDLDKSELVPSSSYSSPWLKYFECIVYCRAEKEVAGDTFNVLERIASSHKNVKIPGHYAIRANSNDKSSFVAAEWLCHQLHVNQLTITALDSDEVFVKLLSTEDSGKIVFDDLRVSPNVLTEERLKKMLHDRVRYVLSEKGKDLNQFQRDFIEKLENSADIRQMLREIRGFNKKSTQLKVRENSPKYLPSEKHEQLERLCADADKLIKSAKPESDVAAAVAVIATSSSAPGSPVFSSARGKRGVKEEGVELSEIKERKESPRGH